MGLLDKLKGKKEEKKEEKTIINEKLAGQVCALCGAAGAEKKWGGQYWHKACMRKSKKMARKMI